MQMYSFYRELKQVCSLKRSTTCICVSCGARSNPAMEEREEEEQMAGFEWLQILAQEENLEELQFQLYMKEIQRLNPTLEDGCLFVDGLYEFVCSRLPVDARTKSPHGSSSARDLLTVHTSGKLLLQKYWKRPQDPEELASYLTVGSSFVQYVLSTWGPEGISEFLQRLDASVVDPQKAEFKFRRRDILELEFKWKRFVEAQVNEKFRLSTPRMLLVLFRSYLLSYWFRLFVVFLIILADVALHLYFSIASVKLMSFGFTDTSLLRVVKWIGIILATIVVRFILMNASIVLQVSVAVNVSNKLRRKLSVRLHAVTPKFLTDHSASSIVSTFVQDVNSIEVVVAYAIRAVLWGVLMLVTLIAYATIVVWPIGVSLAIVFIVNQILVYLISVKLSNHSFAKSQATSKLTDILKEEIDGFAVNRLYRLGAYWQDQLNDVIRVHFTRKARRSLFLTKWILLFQQTVPNLTAALLVFAIILMIQKDWITFENGLGIFIFYSTVVVSMMSALAAIPQIQAATIALGRINALLKNPEHTWEEVEGDGLSEPLKEDEEDDKGQWRDRSLLVEFRNVSFCYEAAASHWNLYDVSVRVNAGERVAIVGKNGSGKSTFLSLVLGMYKPAHGEVIIGNRGCRRRGLVAATFQANHMFNISIRENIRVGRLDATDEEVEEAAKLADIHTWIMSCSRGYDTVVQSGGKSLSGGQRQRIAIARMLVTNAPILILDEVTSALDPLTESRVFQKLMEATAGKTVLAVTHRLAQTQEFDRIIVLSHGRLKESGTHKELLELQGTYWRMWTNKTAESPDKPVPVIRHSSSTPALHQGGNTPRPSMIRRSSVQIVQCTTSTPILSPTPALADPIMRKVSSAQVDPPTKKESTVVAQTPVVNLRRGSLGGVGGATPSFAPLHTLVELKESSQESSYRTASHAETTTLTVREVPAILPVETSTPKDNVLPSQGEASHRLQMQREKVPSPLKRVQSLLPPTEPVVVVVTSAEGEPKVVSDSELTSDLTHHRV